MLQQLLVMISFNFQTCLNLVNKLLNDVIQSSWLETADAIRQV